VTTSKFGIAAGTATFFDGKISLGTSTLDTSGMATLTTSTLAVGTHLIHAFYNGSNIFNASASAQIDADGARRQHSIDAYQSCPGQRGCISAPSWVEHPAVAISAGGFARGQHRTEQDITNAMLIRHDKRCCVA
jgi:hypothetical protein